MSIEKLKQHEPLFGNWHIKEELGAGSYGTVYEIERNDFGATYNAALKAITIPQSKSEVESIRADGLDEGSVTAYFRQMVEEVVGEIVLMSKLKGNSNIVSYEDHTVIKHKHGVGWDILIRMELLQPLIKHVRETSITQNEVVRLGIHICRALELCQRHNIIHRDIKPENIFISENGEYKLGDFGISRTIERTTGVLSQRGTFTYMAPEVFNGRPYGSSVDIYSLGIVMYWLLNENRAPFLPAYPASISPREREMAFHKRISGGVISAPSKADVRLAEIVLKMCAYDRAERYDSLVLLRADLEGILHVEDGPVAVATKSYDVAVKHEEPPALTSAIQYEEPIPPKPEHQSEKTVALSSLFDGAGTDNISPIKVDLYDDIPTDPPISVVKPLPPSQPRAETYTQTTPVPFNRKHIIEDEPQKYASKGWSLGAKVSVIILILFIAVAIPIFFTNFLSNSRNNEAEATATVSIVPSLVNLHIWQAMDMLSDLSLSLVIVDTVYRNDLPNETVLSQNVRSGRVVTRNTVIEVTVSVAREVGYTANGDTHDYNNGYLDFNGPMPQPETLLDPDHPLYHLHRIQARFPAFSGGRSTGAPLYGGHLVHGFTSTEPAPGIFNALFSTSIDRNLMTYIGVNDSIFSTTSTMMMGQHGIATYEVDRANQRIIIRQVENVYWHDGHPLTLDDILFAHEVLGHPNGNWSLNVNQQRITGMMAYHHGETDYISGMILSHDHRTLTIYFDEFPPSILYFGVWSIPYPRHIFGHVPVLDHYWHYHSTVSPIGWGPFMVEYVVPGESITAVANENFWLGRPYLDSVTTQIVHPDMVPSLMLNGDLDIVDFPLQHFEGIPYPTNFMYLGDLGNAYNYVAFNLGSWNPNTQSIDVYQNPRMSRTLRRAMAYASNELLLTEGLFGGLRTPATSFIPPRHTAFLHPELRGFPYNPGLAMQLLDEAGYTIGADGWRTFPDGSELIIHFVISGGDDPAQATVAFHYANAWNDIGLIVDIEWVDWNEKIANIFNADNWAWDVTTAAWSAGASPDPNALWGNTVNNRSRYLNTTLIQHLAGFNSNNAWDEGWLINHYHVWQELMVYYAPAFPTNWRTNLVAVNNRVAGHYIGIAEDGIRTIGGAHRIRVTAYERYRQ